MPGLHINKFSPLIKRHNLAVYHRFIRQRTERRDHVRVALSEIIVIARAQIHLAVGLDGEGAIAVEFYLFCGVARYVAFGYAKAMNRGFSLPASAT